MNMSLSFLGKKIFMFHVLMLFCCVSFATDSLYMKAGAFQREGNWDKAIESFKNYLSQPMDEDDLTSRQTAIYTEALMQLMNTYQSKGEPDACISALQEVYEVSAILQKPCLRDFYSVMGYALSRTENMAEAERTMLKVFTLPLRHGTPERYFRDYAYAAAVFYSNPAYQNDVMGWCEEALLQVEQCKNTSGRQWVTAMLGSLYKRNGHIGKALELFLQSKNEAKEKNDDLGVLNSLHSTVDLFLYWDVPEYANLYASEAVLVEKNMKMKNPMVSAQTYINKGRALFRLGEADSVPFYIEQARLFCQSLPYNSGMVDVNLLNGTFLTDRGGDSLHSGIQELMLVVGQGTSFNRAKAYYQLAQTYLRNKENDKAEVMLDSLYLLQGAAHSPVYVHIDYQPILDYYLKTKNQFKLDQYVRLMLREQQAFKEKKLNFNLIEAIVGLQTEQQRQELRIAQLGQTNQRLWLIVFLVLFVVIILVVVLLLFYQRRRYRIEMKQAGDKLQSLIGKLSQRSAENDSMTQEICDLLNDKDKRQELETLTPSILQKSGDSKFRQCFELLYPLFLPRLREKVPSITRREELLSMLIVLKQDNKEIAELLAIAPRSVLMLRHRFRQKIGMSTDNSLEIFIDDILGATQDVPDNTSPHADTD